MQENFKQALAFVLKDEGGNDDDPADHGEECHGGQCQEHELAGAHGPILKGCGTTRCLTPGSAPGSAARVLPSVQRRGP